MLSRKDVDGQISLRSLIRETIARTARNTLRTALALGLVSALALIFAVARPRVYLISMVVNPVESTISDPTSLISGTGLLSFRSPLNFGVLPTQMAAF